MPNIDTLSIKFNANGTDKAIKNIKAMGYAVSNLAQSVKGIDASKLSAFTSSMETLKKSVPTEAQTNRMVAFGEAVKSLSSAIDSANIGVFSKDMSTLGEAVNTFKKSSVNSITNAVTAMKNMGQTAQQTATAINNATPKASQDVKRGDNRGTLEQAKEMFAALDKVEIKATGIARVMEKLGLSTPTKKFKDLENQAEKVRQKYEELRATLNKALQSGEIQTDSGEFKKKQAELDALKNSYNELILKQRELAQEGGAMQLSPTLVSSLNTFRDGASKAVSILKNGLVGGFRLASRFAKSFSSHIKQAGSSLKNMVTHGKSASNMAKKFANEIFRVSKMLKLMVTRMALRKVIAEVGNGFKSLAIHSDEFNNSVSGIMNASKRLGYSFSAMIGPLINALAPALIYIINIFTKLANIINQVIAALTGATTWNKAREFTDSWRDSIEDAGEEAEKTRKTLKKTVLGFDELNQLQDNTDTTKKGKDSGGIEDMFDTIKIDKKWKDVADWLKQMWKLGDFYDLGKKIGKKLRDMLKSIPWEQIRKTSNKLGRALATLINGFVEVEGLGYDIGKTIAQSVNTVFEFLNGFVHKLHWDSIGKFIADVFNGFFENIDWPLIKDTVVTGMAGIAEALDNFIKTFHWDNISNFIIKAVDVIVSGIKAFVKKIDWRDLGERMGDQLRKTIKGIGWKEVGEALGGIIQAAIDWVAGMLDTMPSAEELVKAATDFLDGIFSEVDSEQLGEELATIFNGIYNFLVGFWEENGDKIKEEVKVFFEGFWNKVDKDALKSVLSTILSFAILGGIASIAWATLKKYLATKMTSVILSSQVKSAVAEAMGELGSAPQITAAAEAAGASTFGWFAKGIIGTGAALDIAGSIKGLFKFDELKEKLESGKISFQEFWKAAGDEGGVTSQNAAWMALDNLTAISKLFREEVARLNSELKSGAITEEQYAEALNLLAPAANEYKEKLSAIIEAYQTGAIPSTTEFNEKVKELKDSYKDQDKVSRDYVESLKKAANAVKTSTDAVDKNKKSSKEGTEQTKKYVDAKKEAVRKFEELTGAANNATDSTSKVDTSLSNLEKSSNKAKEGVKGLSDSMSKDFETSSDDFQKAVKEMEEELSKSFEGIFDSSKDVTEKMPSDFSKGVDDILKSETDLNKTTNSSMSDVVKTFDDATRDITKDFDKIKGSMTKEEWTFQGVADGLGETFKRAREAIEKEWNKVAETLNGEHEVGGSKVKINLPKFARGGFPEDGLFMANRHELVGQFSNGKTAVANNAQIVDGISSGVYSAVSRAMAQNGGSNRYIANTIVVDGDVLARTVTKAQDKQNARYSPAY